MKCGNVYPALLPHCWSGKPPQASQGSGRWRQSPVAKGPVDFNGGSGAGSGSTTQELKRARVGRGLQPSTSRWPGPFLVLELFPDLLKHMGLGSPVNRSGKCSPEDCAVSCYLPRLGYSSLGMWGFPCQAKLEAVPTFTLPAWDAAPARLRRCCGVNSVRVSHCAGLHSLGCRCQERPGVPMPRPGWEGGHREAGSTAVLREVPDLPGNNGEFLQRAGASRDLGWGDPGRVQGQETARSIVHPFPIIPVHPVLPCPALILILPSLASSGPTQCHSSPFIPRAQSEGAGGAGCR